VAGGGGNDTLCYGASGNGVDTIADLTLGDTILVEASLGTITAGNGSAVTGKNVQLSSSGGVTTLWIDTNNAAGAEMQINIAGTYAANALTLVNNGNATSSIMLAGALTLTGTPGNDTLTGAGANDTLSGLAGNDLLTGGAGNDVLDGGADTDTASFAGATGAVTAYLWNGQAVGDGADTLANIENLVGSAFNDRLDGTNTANNLEGGAGADSLYGYGGNDTLTGGVGNDILDGGADTDTASYTGATGAVIVYLWGSQATGADGTDTLTSIENLIGSGFNDRLDGTNTANNLEGGAGADSLYAYAGNDTLLGGAGNDVLDGGANIDTASYAGATGAVTVYLWGSQATGADGTDTLTSIENLTGSAFNDRLDGDNGANSLDGGAAADSVYAYAGNDTLLGGAGNDVLDGGADIDTASYAGATGAVTAYLWNSQVTGADGTDMLTGIENLIGSAFNDRLDGTNSANNLDGGAGSDSLNGYGGNDTLIGGAGNDVLEGGADADAFMFDAGSGIDVIYNYASGQGDKINLKSGLNGSGITSAAQALASTMDVGGYATVNLGSGHTITLVGVTTASLSAADFVIF
jgi:Ca2+-binding RTX toxin-like protein